MSCKMIDRESHTGKFIGSHKEIPPNQYVVSTIVPQILPIIKRFVLDKYVFFRYNSDSDPILEKGDCL